MSIEDEAQFVGKKMDGAAGNEEEPKEPVGDLSKYFK